MGSEAADLAKARAVGHSVEEVFGGWAVRGGGAERVLGGVAVAEERSAHAVLPVVRVTEQADEVGIASGSSSAVIDATRLAIVCGQTLSRMRASRRAMRDAMGLMTEVSCARRVSRRAGGGAWGVGRGHSAASSRLRLDG